MKKTIRKILDDMKRGPRKGLDLVATVFHGVPIWKTRTQRQHAAKKKVRSRIARASRRANQIAGLGPHVNLKLWNDRTLPAVTTALKAVERYGLDEQAEPESPGIDPDPVPEPPPRPDQGYEETGVDSFDLTNPGAVLDAIIDLGARLVTLEKHRRLDMAEQRLEPASQAADLIQAHDAMLGRHEVALGELRDEIGERPESLVRPANPPWSAVGSTGVLWDTVGWLWTQVNAFLEAALDARVAGHDEQLREIRGVIGEQPERLDGRDLWAVLDKTLDAVTITRDDLGPIDRADKTVDERLCSARDEARIARETAERLKVELTDLRSRLDAPGSSDRVALSAGVAVELDGETGATV